MTPADSASTTSANPADPTSADPAEVVAFADFDDPLLWVKPSARTDIAIVDHDEAWAGQYEELAAAIRSVLGDRVLALQHIGSTSVPDLAAKPVIDIDLIVADPRREDDYRPALAEVGYDLVIREPGWYEHRVFRHQDTDGTQRTPLSNLHVFGPHCPEFVRHRLFRDWLTATPDDRRLYEDAKRRAAEESSDAGETTMDYNARKQSVIRDIYRRLFAASGLL
ncbi:GrpB family protein [Brevibacterium ammoniilyticum]|uniref:GrpB family protein n=1 Tax=Brevibacterium ammoniilyticum TaxID=1046555 RepID=A0ABP9U7E9_9MICO